MEKAAQVIQGQLLEIGLQVEVQATDSGTYTQSSNDGNFDMNLNITSSTLNDWSSCNTQYKIQKIGPAYARAEELDELCKQADVETDEQKRKELAAQILNIAVEEAYTLALFSQDSCMALNKNLQGVTMNPNNAWRVMDWSWK